MKISRSPSLATHLTVVVLLACTVALAVFTAVSVWLSRRAAFNQLDAGLSTLAEMVGQNSSAALDFNDRDAAIDVLGALRREPHVVSGCLYSLSGALFAEYHRGPDAGYCPKLRDVRAAEKPGFRSVARPAFHRNDVIGTIFLVAETHELEIQEHRLIGTSLSLAFISVMIAGLSGLILQFTVSKPIAGLAVAMHRVTADESFDVQVPVRGSREIAELSTGFNTMVSELSRRDRLAKLADARLREQARTDSLTGLPNRRLFSENLDKALSAARRRKCALGLLYIDLDGFKLVNDSLGHSIGDMLLCQVASRLNSRIRKSDTLARVGGDEFTVVLTSLRSEKDAGAVAQSILECLTMPFHVEGHEITVGASIGISSLENAQEDGGDLLRQADSAMYAAKRNGRNRAVYFSDDLGLMARERLTLENQLRGAVSRGEIHVYYQPEFDARSGNIVRFEALARWRHPLLGEISPARFIPVAEESGLIHSIGAHIMEQACRDAMSWQALSRRPIQVAVNVSAIQFNTDDIVREIRETLARTGLAPHLFQVELTESVMMGSIQRATEKMKALHALGVNLALDDFGTGYSCLSYLHELPFGAIKLDRSFVAKLSPSFEANKVVRSIVDLAHGMKMRVIVEGIEEESQLAMVKELGADEIQGFLLGRPTPNPAAHLKSPRMLAPPPDLYSSIAPSN